MLVNPRSAEKRPWKMFFIGLLYASLSLLLVHFLFKGDSVLSKYSGLIVVTFCVMFSLPFMYRMIRREEREDEEIEGFFGVWKVHKDVIYAFIWLFLGFIFAFSLWGIILQDANLFNAQIETYCMINNPDDINGCVNQYSFTGQFIQETGGYSNTGRFLSILENNIYVMIFTLFFSLIFGAGAIFILAWNATVIASAVGIFARYQVVNLPLGVSRYLIHGIPEIVAYFVTALAGGIFGVGYLRHGLKDKKFFRVTGNAIILLFIAIAILVVAALVEVYITPRFFS